LSRYVILALFVGLAAVTLNSFYADNHEVEAAARALACSGHVGPCAPRLARFERSPMRQTFVFRMGGADVSITCRHASLLVGAYACQRDGTP
jgi:hypothetical protein